MFKKFSVIFSLIIFVFIVHSSGHAMDDPDPDPEGRLSCSEFTDQQSAYGVREILVVVCVDSEGDYTDEYKSILDRYEQRTNEIKNAAHSRMAKIAIPRLFIRVCATGVVFAALHLFMQPDTSHLPIISLVVLPLCALYEKLQNVKMNDAVVYKTVKEITRYVSLSGLLTTGSLGTMGGSLSGAACTSLLPYSYLFVKLLKEEAARVMEEEILRCSFSLQSAIVSRFNEEKCGACFETFEDLFKSNIPIAEFECHHLICSKCLGERLKTKKPIDACLLLCKKGPRILFFAQALSKKNSATVSQNITPAFEIVPEDLD